ncbi:Intracellular sulfur oxidation protein, DsrE/DsrF family [Paramicrobacterium humi]|uniref:Intracellular sulfur oxidation protein, DsrE/DsrF family n=1 Tax=Paramicrobacterium humi TaxID=640635 RepID=A0A1H4MDA5_9MICO|nr:hypothetical protein [Microbacterium humi]SEB80724.1 Intracellular sulfur oxidation protein, DsrE/DsrF family [Microbacterium humi]
MNAPRILALHVTGAADSDVLDRGVRSAVNFRELDANAEVVIVVQGAVVTRLLRPATVPALPSGTRLIACENSLAGNDIRPEDLPPGVETTPAAVAYLARLQWAGAAYIRV